MQQSKKFITKAEENKVTKEPKKAKNEAKEEIVATEQSSEKKKEK